MNKFSIIAVLFLVNAAFATTFLKSGSNSPIFAQLKKIEESSFGKNLLDTIALQVQNQSPLSDISKLLSNLKSDLERQQAEADTLQQEREEDCAQTIAEYNRRINEDTQTITETTERISVLVRVIDELEAKIANAERDLEETEGQLQSARDADAQARAEFAVRQQKFDGVLEAVELIIEKLVSQRDKQESQLEFETALLALAKIGKKNPIAALAQIAATLPREDWERAVQIMQTLKESTQTKKQNDIDSEDARSTAFVTLEAQLMQQISDLKALLQQARADLAENQEDLVNTRSRKAAAEADLASATEGLAQKTAQCNKWREDYERDSAKRTDEIAIVEKVQTIFANRINSAKDYLKERVDQE